jgi:hypothetical protein
LTRMRGCGTTAGLFAVRLCFCAFCAFLRLLVLPLLPLREALSR